MRQSSQPLVSVILSQKYAILCSRSKHPVWFIYSFEYEVIDEYTYVSLISAEYERLFAMYVIMCIDSGDETLGCGYCIRLAGSEVPDALALLRRNQLSWRKVYYQGEDGVLEERRV